MLAVFTRVVVSDDVARDRTETAGAAQVALQTAEVERLEREAPLAPAGPPKQYLSADGAFVPLVGGVWGEVKSVVIGGIGGEDQAAICRDAQEGRAVSDAVFKPTGIDPGIEETYCLVFGMNADGG